MKTLYLHIDEDAQQSASATSIAEDVNGLRIKSTVSLDPFYRGQCRGQISEYIRGRGFVVLLDMGCNEGAGAAWHAMSVPERARLRNTPKMFREWMLGQLGFMDAIGRSIAKGTRE